MQLDRDALIAARETLMMELKSMKEETSAAPGEWWMFHDFSMIFPWKNGGFPWKNWIFPWKNGGLIGS